MANPTNYTKVGSNPTAYTKQGSNSTNYIPQGFNSTSYSSPIVFYGFLLQSDGYSLLQSNGDRLYITRQP